MLYLRPLSIKVKGSFPARLSDPLLDTVRAFWKFRSPPTDGCAHLQPSLGRWPDFFLADSCHFLIGYFAMCFCKNSTFGQETPCLEQTPPSTINSPCQGQSPAKTLPINAQQSTQSRFSLHRLNMRPSGVTTSTDWAWLPLDVLAECC